MGKGAFREPNESCLMCCGLPPLEKTFVGKVAEGGLQFTFLAFSARSALNSKSRGEFWCEREGIGIGAPREGDGEGDEPESEPSSGGGVGGPVCVLGGTDFERNLGIGRAEGAGEAWNVGPAYAPWVLAGVAAGWPEPASVSVREAA